MSAASAVSRGRALAEAQFDSVCVIFTPGAAATDPATGLVTYAEDDAASAVCKVRPNGYAQSRGLEVGGAEVIVTSHMISIPFGYLPVPRDRQWVRVTAAPDPALLGARFEIRQVAKGTVTARRLMCNEVA